MQAALEAARAWLQGARGADGGWSYRPGQTSRPEPSILLAAAGLEPPLGWLEAHDLGWAGRLVPTILRDNPGAGPLRERELNRLLTRRSRTGMATADFDASLPAWGWVEGTAGWTEPTAHALLALRAAGRGDAPEATQATAFLLDRQGADGGWNYGNPRILGRDLDSAPVATGWTLLALAGLGGSSLASARGLAWLRSRCAELPTSHSLALLVLAERAHGDSDDATAQALRARQGPDGAWLGRADLTALACAALAAAGGAACPMLPEGA